ncbi:hypothetical protein MKX03_020080 [Papaver bracteatum]|nr:hypothetical protein MKX03_020080 [Papaver bracteatum]
MFVMVKLDTLLLEDISDDMDFCIKPAAAGERGKSHYSPKCVFAKRIVLGLKNCLRITFSIDLTSLKDAMDKMKSFCQKHAKPR